MNNEKILILAIFLVSLLAISTVSAADNATDAVGINNQTTDEIVNVENNNQVIKSAAEGFDYLSVNSDGTFTDLANDIANANGELKLTKNYVYDSSKDSNYANGIVIDKEITINGRGFVINGDNSARAFTVSSGNVILRNIEFVNCSSSDSGGAVYWSGSNGNLFDCNFINCHSSISGGAVYWNGASGSLFDCDFINCYSSKTTSISGYSSSSSSNYGGAVYWDGAEGNLSKCSFRDCRSLNYNHNSYSRYSSNNYLTSTSNSYSNSYGGAVYWNGVSGSLFDCEFINCYSYCYSYSYSYCSTVNSRYTSSCSSSSTSYSYGSVYWKGSNGNLFDSVFINSTSSFSSGLSSGYDSWGTYSVSYSYANSSCYGGAVYWNGDDGNLSDCDFITSQSNSGYGSTTYRCGGAIYWYGDDGSLLNSSFINCHVPAQGYAHGVYWKGANGDLFNCSFINSSSSSNSGYNGSVYWNAKNGDMFNCSFDGNYYDYEKYCSKSTTSTVYPVIFIYTSSLKNDERMVIFESTQLVNNIYVTLYNVTDRKVLYDEFDISSEDLSNSLNLNYLEEGEYQIVLDYAGDSFFTATSTNDLCVVGKNASYEVTITDGLVEGDNATITLTLNDDATGEVKFTLSDFTCINELVGGKTSINISNVGGGINEYKIKYIGDDKYNPIYIDDTFIVMFRSDICLDLNENYIYDENIALDYAIAPNCTGTIRVFVDGELKADVSVGDEFELENIGVGEHVLFVIYDGNEYFLSSNDSAIFTVSKATPSIEVNSSSVDGTASFEIVLNEKATGFVTVTLNDDTYVETLADGKANITISNLNPGDYDCLIRYEGDANYNPVNTSQSINVAKWTTKIIAENCTFIYGDDIVLELTMANDTADGNITLYVDDVDYRAAITNGRAILTIPALDAGTYPYTVRYDGNQYYDGAYADGIIVITKSDDISMDVSYGKLVYASPAAMNVTFSKPVSGTVSFALDGVNYIGEVTDGKATFTLDNLNVKTYKITLAYSGDGNYESKDKEISFTVGKAVPTVNFTISNNNYGETLVVNVQAPSDVTRRPGVSVDGNVKYVSVKSGSGTVKFTDLSVGTHDIVVSYGGDGNYAKASNSSTFEVNKGNANIKLTANAVNFGEDLTVNVEMPSDVNGDVEVAVGKIIQIVSLNNGVGTAAFSGLAIGSYAVKADYAGDNNYLKSSAKLTAKVNKAILDLELTAEAISAGENLVVKIQAPSDIKYRVNVTVGGMSKLVSLKNGVGTATFSGLTFGNYVITASYGGDSKYLKSSAKTTVKVNRGAADIKITADTVGYGDDVVITVQMPSDVTRRVNVTVGGVSKLVSLKNGVGSVSFSGFAIGTYDVSVSYGGDAKYLKSSASTVVKVDRATPEIQVTANDITYGETALVYLSLPSEVSRRAVVEIGDDSKAVSLTKGSGVAKFTGLTVGTHKVKVSYNGDALYKAFSTETTITVKN